MSRAALANPSVVRLLVLLVVAVATGTSGVAIAQTYSTILDSSEDQTPQGVRGAGGSNALLAASYTPAGATAPQGMWWLGNLATNTGTAYKFNPVIGDQVVTSALYYGPDTAEFNPSLGAGNIRIVGSYQYTGSTQDNNGVLYTGPLTGVGGTWTQINVPDAPTGGTVANTIPHSVMGSIAVGNYNLLVNGSAVLGNAFLYNVTTQAWTIFDAPFAWLAAAETDVRTVRLRPAPDLEIAPDLPAGITLVKPRDEDGLATTAVWRSDALGPAADTRPGAEPRARIVVRRRDPQPAAVQDLVVEFAEDHVGLRLRCRLDTDEAPLLEVPFVVPPAAIIDSISLTREPPAEAAAQPPQRMDITWSREAADRIVAVVQRPETGRFRLQLDARLPIRPARRGRLPIARIAADDLPLELACRTAAGLDFRVELPAADGFTPARVELASGQTAPAYVLTRTSPAGSDADEGADDLPGSVAGERAVATIVDLAIDGRGRAWGLVRFDVVAVQQVVRLVLPAGLRLFDVRADGRQVTAVPAEGNALDVRLHDVAWPRSLVAVIAGTLGGRLADGSAIRLEPPRLAGLPAGEVLWSVDTPAGFAVRVLEPARLLDPSAFAAVRDEVRDGLDAVFRDAIRAVDRAEREPLEGFAATRRDGGGSVGERSWYEAWRGGSADAPNRTLIAPGGDGSVTIRAERVRGGAVPSRVPCPPAGWPR